jgi:anion-transporting  ArsA/GET3 family ATPase
MPQNQAQRAGPKILFVSGKGGVGKSLVAAAVAKEETLAGKRVLLVEIGDTSYYKDFWDLPAVGHDPIRLNAGFDLALWSGETCLREYVLYYLKLERLYNVFFENKVMRSLIGVAPGLNEIAILGKITSGIRKVGPPLNYDLIVVDCYATGHALALLQAPKGMMEAIKIGPMGHHSREIERVLLDSSLTAYMVVTLLEEMPVVETLEFRANLKRELGLDCEVVGNKLIMLPVKEKELKDVAEHDGKGLGEFARYLNAIAARQKEFTDALLRETGSLRQVPLIFSSEPDELVNAAGEALRQA